MWSFNGTKRGGRDDTAPGAGNFARLPSGARTCRRSGSGSRTRFGAHGRGTEELVRTTPSLGCRNPAEIGGDPRPGGFEASDPRGPEGHFRSRAVVAAAPHADGRR